MGICTGVLLIVLSDAKKKGCMLNKLVETQFRAVRKCSKLNVYFLDESASKAGQEVRHKTLVTCLFVTYTLFKCIRECLSETRCSKQSEKKS